MIQEDILNFLETNNQKYDTVSQLYAQISKALSLAKEKVISEIAKLLQSGVVIEYRRKIVSTKSLGLRKAKVVGNARGFAFAVILGEKTDDLFLPPNKLSGAMNGDIVLVLPQNSKTFTGKLEGEVIKILTIANATVVGTYTDNRFGGMVECDNVKFSKPIFIKKGKNLNAGDGQKVVVKITKHPTGEKMEKIEGEIIEILGRIEDPKVLELSIIRSHNLYEEFTDAVLAAAEKVPQVVHESSLKNRLDLTNDKIFTIDGADAKDLDDAVSIEILENGNYKLGVHIADVGQYVRRGSEIDEEAFLRGTSAYFPDLVLPMLPRSLSNGICSLNPNVIRLTLSVFMEIDKNGKVCAQSFHESFIKSCARLTYDEVFACVSGDPLAVSRNGELVKKFVQMNELAKILQEKRRESGSLDFEIPEAYIETDANGEPTIVLARERNDAHKLIESFMVVCNEVVAKHFVEKKLPFVYRIHEVPTKEKMEASIEFVQSLGVFVDPLGIVIEPAFVQKILKSVQDKPFAKIVNTVLLRSMQKAKYFEKCLGHFGLALTHYCHFTSPIRRYPDLTIHRILKDEINGRLSKEKLTELEEFVVESSQRSSESEKNATEAEREVDDLKKAQYMSKHVGEEFVGKVSSVTNFGLFVELDNTIEGFIKLETLPLDEYKFNERLLILKGNFRSFRLGDDIKILVAAANPFTRKIDFMLKV